MLLFDRKRHSRSLQSYIQTGLQICTHKYRCTCPGWTKPRTGREQRRIWLKNILTFAFRDTNGDLISVAWWLKDIYERLHLKSVHSRLKRWTVSTCVNYFSVKMISTQRKTSTFSNAWASRSMFCAACGCLKAIGPLMSSSQWGFCSLGVLSVEVWVVTGTDLRPRPPQTANRDTLWWVWNPNL